MSVSFFAQTAFDEKSHIKLYSDRFSPNSPKRENPTKNFRAIAFLKNSKTKKSHIRF
jgi:hypothetical protein